MTPEVARDLGRGHPAGLVRAGHHAQGEQVLLGRRGQVARVVASGHDLRIRDQPSTRRPGPAARWRSRDRPARRPRAARPRVARREASSAAAPVADRTSVAATAAASRPRAAAAASEASTGGSSRPTSAAPWSSRIRGLDRRVAGRGEPAAAGQLADHPADAERDRQPADDRSDHPATRTARVADRSALGPGRRGPGRDPAPARQAAAAWLDGPPAGGIGTGVSGRLGGSTRPRPPGGRLDDRIAGGRARAGRAGAGARARGRGPGRRGAGDRLGGASVSAGRRASRPSPAGRAPGTRGRACAGRRTPSG